MPGRALLGAGVQHSKRPSAPIPGASLRTADSRGSLRTADSRGPLSAPAYRLPFATYFFCLGLIEISLIFFLFHFVLSENGPRSKEPRDFVVFSILIVVDLGNPIK